MIETALSAPSVAGSADLRNFLRRVRRESLELAAPLSDADATAQAALEASPAKWHLAHATWFFEAMVLEPYGAGYTSFNPDYGRLFNSYYDSLGDRHPRALRGMLTRPSLDDVLAYRRHVDAALEQALDRGLSADALRLIELGCHHEQQHQELLLADILLLFSLNPLKPAYRTRPQAREAMPLGLPASWISFDGGLIEHGHSGNGFAFDSETPVHQAFIEPFRLASRPVTNAEWIEFVEDGGYRQPLLWLAEGWDHAQRNGWTLPLHWEEQDGEYAQMTLGGMQHLDLDAPVSHISLFEAEAFARWSDARLPTEFEWELAARGVPLEGNFSDSGLLAPRRGSVTGLGQMFGDVWEWTRSPFTPYPRFKPAEGAVGEYNGKFMSGQFVLRGGSCVTPAGHMRASYRNFFAPQSRWQFSGLRLAEDH